MTHSEFNAILARLDLTQVGAAKLLGVTDRQARRYAAGDSHIPQAAAKLLRLLARGALTVEQIQRA
jgi:DNA-binding transcriptional regulator YiaG